jgi:ABC-type amino acid transport system permease subunit
VVDFTWVLAGPFATRIMGDLGADILKFQTAERATLVNSPNFPFFYVWNRSKRLLSLDMKRSEAPAIIRKVVEQSDVLMENFSAGVLALAIFCSSHVGEIVRGALQAIPKGQTEAAKAIGLTFTQTFTSVLWPQAMRQCLPAWVNTAAEMVKASTLLSVIGVAELLLRTQEIISRNFMSLQFYFLAGGLYFIINYGIEHFGKYVERKTALPS